MILPGLSVPQTDLKFRIHNQQKQLWDVFRKKWIAITPEEWVRQQVLHFMVKERNFPSSLIALENGLSFAGRKKRTDAKIYSPGGAILLLMEFKAPGIQMNESTILQASVYAGILNPQFVLLSNGIQHFWISLLKENPGKGWQSGIPHFNELSA